MNVLFFKCVCVYERERQNKLKELKRAEVDLKCEVLPLLRVLRADSSHSSSSTKGERLSAKMRSLPSSSEPYETSSPKELGERAAPSLPASLNLSHRPTYQRLSCADASYVDPLGPQAERPKTGAKKRLEEDEFADEELGDDLLPE